MYSLTSKFALSLLSGALALSIGVGMTPADAGQRYQPREAVEAPREVQEAWLHQLKRTQRVNAAGVVFANPAPTNRRSAAGRSIFSPNPFGTRQVVRPRAGTPRHVVRPGYGQPVATRAAAVREVAPRRVTSPQFLPQRVSYDTRQKPGTIVIDTNARFLYHVEPGGTAMRYGVGVGKPGFSWRGTHNVTRKKEWPSWTPPKEMIAREKKKGRDLPNFMPGGRDNPLGARALYLGSTLYRIHGTNQPWTIGKAVSSGCIRMRNEDVTELYRKVGVGTKVVVL